MYTDWLLIRRLAWELQERFSGARVRDVGELPDGRFALALWSAGATTLVCIDPFAPTPAITLERDGLPVAIEPGFVRAAGAALRGTTVLSVRARKGDRVLRFDFGSRSRFGVETGYALICELVPKFGNIVLVKASLKEPDRLTVVAAAKEFAPADNAIRSIQVGASYEPPPLRRGRSSSLLEESTVAHASEQRLQGDVHVYRQNGTLVQAHVVPLPQYDALQHSRASSLLELLNEDRNAGVHSAQSDRLAKTRRTLERTLARRREKIVAELEHLEQGANVARQRDALRIEGESIYAQLHELPSQLRAPAKQRAAELFARYKKSAARSEHLERRRGVLDAALSEIAELQWELERATDADLDDVAQTLASLEPARRAPAPPVRRKRAPLQVTLPLGSRAYIGRTPLENADLTFRVARPDDLWLHVRNQPGAHVIVQRDDRATPAPEDVIAAAQLAAFHSKAKESAKVVVDYTLRKHVRKRPASAPGLVFYTHAQSVTVAPSAPHLEQLPAASRTHPN